MEKLSDKIQNKINIYFDHLWNTAYGFDEQKEILDQLPSHLKIDALKERYQESIENSIIFEDMYGENDQKVVDSFLKILQIEIYMPRDFIIKAGSLDDKFYFILEGEAVLVGLVDEVIGILKSGAHLSKDLGTGL